MLSVLLHRAGLSVSARAHSVASARFPLSPPETQPHCMSPPPCHHQDAGCQNSLRRLSKAHSQRRRQRNEELEGSCVSSFETNGPQCKQMGWFFFWSFFSSCFSPLLFKANIDRSSRLTFLRENIGVKSGNGAVALSLHDKMFGCWKKIPEIYKHLACGNFWRQESFTKRLIIHSVFRVDVDFEREQDMMNFLMTNIESYQSICK